jgi:hypothetical protein
MATSEDIIGRPKSEDYRLQPSLHAEEYREKAPKLAAILESSRVGAIVRSYEENDAEAALAQGSYKKAAGWANGLILSAATLGAAMMAMQILFGDTHSVLVAILGVLSGLAGSAAAGCLFWASGSGKLNEWLQFRAAAETQRLALFEAIVAPVAGEPADVELDLLRLAYFRRYQLNVQIAFFAKRGVEHRNAADWTLLLGAVAATCASLASLAAGGASFASSAAVSLGALAVFAAALSSYATNSEALSQDRRNSQRYRTAKEALRELEARFGSVEDEVRKGNREAAVAYVKVVNEQLASEHKQWLASSEAIREVATKLEDALAATRRRAAVQEQSGASSAFAPQPSPGPAEFSSFDWFGDRRPGETRHSSIRPLPHSAGWTKGAPSTGDGPWAPSPQSMPADPFGTPPARSPWPEVPPPAMSEPFPYDPPAPPPPPPPPTLPPPSQPPPPSPPPARTTVPSSASADISVIAPPLVKPSRTFFVQVWIAPTDQREAMLEQATRQGSMVEVGSRLRIDLARESLITIVLDLPDFEIDDPVALLGWTGDIGNVDFKVKAPADLPPGKYPGLAKLLRDQKPFASIWFELAVDASAPADMSSIMLPSTVRRISRAFASYASQDRAEVLRRVHGMQAVGTDVFLDIVDLRVGEQWEPALYREIKACDGFFLFWSRHAQESPWVEKEWRYAAQNRGKSFISPLPLEDPRLAKPPVDLADKHFNDMILAFIKNEDVLKTELGTIPP